MENISMHCTVVSRKPFKHSQAQQFAKKTQISFLSLQLPAERVVFFGLLFFGLVFFFFQVESAAGSTEAGHSFC